MAIAPNPTLNTTPAIGSAVSWPAVIAGAVVSAALSLILILLGTGIGLSSISPYGNSGASATTFTISTAVWVILAQIISAGMGGYLAGRLRTRWTGVHQDEVHFRDTAHGFLSWAVGAIVGASLLASAAGSLLGTGTQAAGSLVSGLGSSAAGAVGAAGSTASNNAGAIQGYFTDMLFRSDKPASDPANPGTSAEIGRIMARSLADGSVSPGDKTYVAHAIAAKTGLSQADAEKRIDDTVAQAKAAADKAAQTAKDAADAARKAAAYLSLWLFVSMLVGAFSSSYAATLGGRGRDASALAR